MLSINTIAALVAVVIGHLVSLSRADSNSADVGFHFKVGFIPFSVSWYPLHPFFALTRRLPGRALRAEDEAKRACHHLRRRSQMTQLPTFYKLWVRLGLAWNLLGVQVSVWSVWPDTSEIFGTRAYTAQVTTISRSGSMKTVRADISEELVM